MTTFLANAQSLSNPENIFRLYFIPPSSEKRRRMKSFSFRTKMRLPATSGSNGEGNEKEELVGGTAEKRNWRGIIISLLVILLICALIVVAIIIATPEIEVYEKFTFEDIFDHQYQPKYYDAVWLSENEYILRDSTNNIVAVDVMSNETTILITNRTMDDEGIIRVWVETGKEHVLVTTQERKIFRYSYEAIYKIYNVQTKTLMPLSPPGISNPVLLQYAGWAPQGSKLVFVYENNIYYQNAINNPSMALTDDGVEGEIFNGVPDWVYEEEILSSNNAIYWYEDGTQLIFASFNDTEVPKAWYPKYDNKVYSELKFIKYPKPGYPNPTVKLYVALFGNEKNLVEIKPPPNIQDQVHYYTSVVWKNQYIVAITWLNRPQNISWLTLCQVDSGDCSINHNIQTPNGWIVQSGDIIFAADKMSYFTILPQREGSSGNFYHIAQVTSENIQREVTFLTSGRWEVTRIVAYNSEKNLLFFISNEHGAGNRTLFRYDVDGGKKSCVTCAMFHNCSYFSADFNDAATRYLLQCHGPFVPQTALLEIDSENYTMMEDNSDVINAFKNKDYIVKKFYTTKSSDGHYDIPIELHLPRSIDRARQHPLMIDVYAGPGSQHVDTKFMQGWYTYLMSTHHIIVARIDGRGSGFKGDKMMYEIYKRLGTVEIEDQVTATNYLLQKENFLDWNKTAIWGWSYGGFAASLAAARGVYNCTMAVAPVTDWRFYDSVYTERYMGLPKATDNLQGYKESNVSAHVSHLHRTNYLLVHGLADDNVHFQNSANLVRALVHEGLNHQVQYYPDEGHDLDDPMVLRDLYKTLSDFLLRCLEVKC